MKTDHLIEQYILAHMAEEPPLMARIYRETQLRMVNGRMCSDHLLGTFLSMMSRIIRPSAILEIGTYTGYSALCLVQGLRDGGKLHTIEINDELEQLASSFFEESGYRDRIIQYIGDAGLIIPGLQETFDLVFLDADKRMYWEHYELVLPRVRQGGIIIADNTLWGGKVLKNPARTDEQTRGILRFNELIKHDHRVDLSMLPVRDGISILRKR